MIPNTTIRQPSRSTQLSILYITIGVLLTIWSSVWYYFLRDNATPTDSWRYYVCVGLLLSGVALFVIGILLGRIGREAQNADVPVGHLMPATPTVAATPAAPVAPETPVTPAAPVAQAVPGQVPARPAAGS